jgi:plastocyanin
MRRLLSTVFLFGFALVLGSCGGSEQSSADFTISMLDNSFSEDVFQVPVGATVEFVNNGRNPHNAFAVDGSWSTQDATGDSIMLADETALLTFADPGTYEFFCSIHASEQDDGSYEGMVATLVVGDDQQAAAETDAGTDVVDEWTGFTRAVPTDYPTIQSGVDAADPGDLVLVEPGVYREAVSVTTPYITIRGTDRNDVILDGEFTRENGIAVTADGVAIENMTARNYTINGFFWNGVTGYRGSYLTAIDDWVYGIYAFDSVDGLLEHSYASGSWDAGFYIGQCRPCDAVVTDVLAEYNGLGYSGTNSSGNIWIVDSEWRNNVGGIVPNTLDSELLPPVSDVVVAGNYVHDNGEDELAPNRTAEWSAFGNGILLAGARDSVVRNNLLVNNRTSGVLVVSMIDKNLWPSGGNQVLDNVSMGSGRSDYALGGPGEQGSCFAGNDGDSTTPRLLGLLHSCEGINIPSPWSLAAGSNNLGRIAEVNAGLNPQLEHGEAPKPSGPLENLPGGADAPVRPAVAVFASLDFDPASITTPSLPAGVDIADSEVVFMGIVLNSGFWPVTMGLLLSTIPTLAWLLGSLWSLWRIWKSTNRSTAWRAFWSVIVVLVPVLGALVYLAAADSTDRRLRRVGVVGAGAFTWLAATGIAVVVGGIV